MSLLFPSATRLKRQCTWVLRNKHDRCVAMAHEVSHWKRSIVSVKGFLSAEFLHHGTGLAKCKVKIATMALRCDKISSYNQDSVWSWFICFCTTIRMIVTIGFTFALGVLFPVLMDSFKETREKTGEFHMMKYPTEFICDDCERLRPRKLGLLDMNERLIL